MTKITATKITPTLRAASREEGTAAALGEISESLKVSLRRKMFVSDNGRDCAIVRNWFSQVIAYVRRHLLIQVSPILQLHQINRAPNPVFDATFARDYAVPGIQRVAEAENGAAALNALTYNPDVDLLFTDVVMRGGIKGRQLANQALAVKPTLKVLFTTGYTRNAIVHQGRLDPDVDLIGRPYSFEQLAAKICACLDAVN